jgi:Zn-dependent protease with chaperone function
MMRTLLKPLAIVLAVPVLATALGLLGRSEWDSRWSATLARQFAAQRMRPDGRLLARYSLATLCADRRTGTRLPPCRTYNLFSTVIGASAVAGGAGFVLLTGLLVAGFLCRGNRRRLARLFRPSLALAAGGTALVAIVNAALAVAAVIAGTTYLFSEPIERVSTSLVLVAGTAGVVWAIAMVAVAFSVTRRPTITLVGWALDPATQRPLLDEVRRAAEAVGASVPGNIVACLAPWLFVTEVKVACLDGVLSGRTLCLSLPLGRILSIDEFRALLAHELAHFSAEDEGFATRVSPFLTGASRTLERLGRQSLGIRAAAVAPPVALLSFFMEAVRGGAEPGGDREFAADRAAAAVAGREALGSALVKAQAFAPAWHGVARAMQDAADAGTQYLNSSALFQEIVAANAGPDRLQGIAQQSLDHPTDRHPVLARRLTALGLDLPLVAAAALVTAPAAPAVSLVVGYEALEERLSTAEHHLLVETGGEP